nr:hypothetical protein [Tanacetum cinerariifolium]
MHKAFPLLVRKFPLPEGTSHCLKMNDTVRRIEMPLPEVCTAIEEKKKKLPVKDRWHMEDEHLNTILAMKSDEFIKSCVENLVLNPKSMLNHDSSIIHSSSKIDSLLDEFAGELTPLKSIPQGIDKTGCHPENEIRLIKRLLYDNSFPRLPKEFVSKNSNTEIKSFSPSLFPVEDSDSRMEEINLFLEPDDPMSPGIEDDDYDSKRDILILVELLDNYSFSFPVTESYHFDIPSFSHPSAKSPDGNTGILNIKMMGDVSEQKVPILGLTITRVPNQEKSPDLLSHLGLKIFQLSAKCPMMIHRKNIPTLDVPLFYFYPLDQLKYGGISLLHLSGSQQMLKSSYKAEDGVIISIPPLVGGVADVVVEIKGTGWSISITFRFSVGLQTPDDLSRSRLGFIEKMGNKTRQKTGSEEEPSNVKAQSQSRKQKREEIQTQGTNTAKSKDNGKGIMVEEPKPLKKKAQIEQDEAYARELKAELNKNIDRDEVIDHVQRKEKEYNVVKKYQALKRKPQTEAQARKNMMIYLTNMMEEEDSRALKRLSESQEDKAAKKQKLDEEVKELRKNLIIVPNEDDVYTEATPLTRKVPVVDYEIYTENNKPYYKIKSANGSHQLYLSFLSMLRNFDREDLEVL